METPTCVQCQKPLNPKTMAQVGLNCEMNTYTLKDELATQGWFNIGRDCLKKLKRNGELLEQQSATHCSCGYQFGERMKFCPYCGKKRSLLSALEGVDA